MRRTEGAPVGAPSRSPVDASMGRNPQKKKAPRPKKKKFLNHLPFCHCKLTSSQYHSVKKKKGKRAQVVSWPGASTQRPTVLTCRPRSAKASSLLAGSPPAWLHQPRCVRQRIRMTHRKPTGATTGQRFHATRFPSRLHTPPCAGWGAPREDLQSWDDGVSSTRNGQVCWGAKGRWRSATHTSPRGS